MANKTTKSQGAERGSALVEFTLLLSVVLPLGFGMAMIGKLTDLKQTTEQASRYAAWEATVYSRHQLAGTQQAAVEARFFGAPDIPITSQLARNSKRNHQDAVNPLWGSSQATPASMKSIGEVARQPERLSSTSYRFDTGKAEASVITGKAVEAAGIFDGFDGNSWGLVADGMLQSSVDIAIRPTGLLRATQGSCGVRQTNSGNSGGNDSTNTDEHVCIRSSGVILADGWAASNDRQAVSRIRSLVPGSTLQKVGRGVGNLLGSTVFPELDPLDKAFGHVNMKVLPRYAKP